MMTLRIMAAAALAAGSMALFAASAARAAETVYPLATVQLYAAASGGAAIGSATPGTPLAVTAAAAGGREQVMVEGWSRKGGDSIVLQAPGLNIELAKLTPAARAHRKLLGQRRDRTGATWEHVEVTAWVARKDVESNVNTVWAAAYKLYSTHCNACHALRAPSSRTANAWPRVLSVMERNAGFNAQQAALVTKYMQEHAKK
jgi:trimethylamine-N-oxide reductase cytochrome c-type subunit TorC